MKKEIIKYIIMLVVLILLPLRYGAAQEIMIDRIGNVELDENTTVKRNVSSKGEQSYYFIAKEGPTWHVLQLAAIRSVPDVKNVVMLDQAKQLAFLMKNSNSQLLEVTDPQILSFENAREAVKISTFKANEWSVVNTQVFFLKGESEMKLFTVTCVDGDTNYWRPMIERIIVSAELN